MSDRKQRYGRIGYGYTHVLLRNTKGPAKEYLCVDCNEQAAHWSLSAYAEETLYEVGTRDEGKAYSHNLDDYEPRCRRCHSAYDKKHRLMRGPEGFPKGAQRNMGDRKRGLCSVEGCDNPHGARGYCYIHYKREGRKNGGVWDA